MLAVLAAALLASPFAAFEGHWRCEGRFVASGKPIRSELTMATDPASGVFVVRHDDTAPMAYHSLETWTADPHGSSLRAAVADQFSGLRVFRSPPVQDGVLAFTRPEGDEAPQEEFRYALTGQRELRVDWSVARPGQPLHLGDTLRCLRTAT